MKFALVSLMAVALLSAGCGGNADDDAGFTGMRDGNLPGEDDEIIRGDELPSYSEPYKMPDFEVEEKFIRDEPAEEPEPHFDYPVESPAEYRGESAEARETSEPQAREEDYDPRSELRNMGFEYNRWDFIQAAGDGNAGAVMLFLESGMDPDSVNSPLYGETALIRAARKGKYEALTALIEGGAEVNKRDANGETALGYARMFGYVEIAAVLEEAGGRR